MTAKQCKLAAKCALPVRWKGINYDRIYSVDLRFIRDADGHIRQAVSVELIDERSRVNSIVVARPSDVELFRADDRIDCDCEAESEELRVESEEYV